VSTPTGGRAVPGSRVPTDVRDRRRRVADAPRRVRRPSSVVDEAQRIVIDGTSAPRPGSPGVADPLIEFWKGAGHAPGSRCDDAIGPPRPSTARPTRHHESTTVRSARRPARPPVRPLPPPAHRAKRRCHRSRCPGPRRRPGHLLGPTRGSGACPGGSRRGPARHASDDFNSDAQVPRARSSLGPTRDPRILRLPRS